MVVEDGHQERTDGVGVALLDVRAGGDEQARGLEPAVPRRVEQRRHAALGFGAPAAIGQAAAVDADALGSAARALARRNEARRRSFSRLRVDGRAALEKERDGRGLILADGEHQRGLLKLRVARVHARTGVDEHAHRVGNARLRRRHERCLAGRINCVRIGSGGEETPDHRRVAVEGRKRKGSDAVAIGRRHVGAGLQQEIRDVQVVGRDGVVQRRRSVHAARVHVGTLLDERAHDLHVAAAGRVGQRRRRPGRQRGRQQNQEQTGDGTRPQSHPCRPT